MRCSPSASTEALASFTERSSSSASVLAPAFMWSHADAARCSASSVRTGVGKGYEVEGDALAEISPDRTIETLWSLWDSHTPGRSRTYGDPDRLEPSGLVTHEQHRAPGRHVLAVQLSVDVSVRCARRHRGDPRHHRRSGRGRADHRTREYQRQWSYDADQGLSTLDQEYERVWQAQMPLGTTFGYAHPVTGLSAEP